MKILVIGLDAATMDLIEPWTAAGHLPTLARLMADCASSRLLSTPNMHSASAWTSILTGLNPGRHGLFVFSDRDFATGKQLFFKGGDRTGDLISAHLSRSGLNSGFLNVPMTYPAQAEPGGFVVSGLDSPSLSERAFSPPELRAELLGRFPGYHFTPQNLGDLMRAGALDQAIESWMKLIDIQTAAAEYLLDSHPVDFFMTVYTASDWGGHNLWQLHQDSNQGSRVTSNPLLDIYQGLDAAIARLLAHATDETHVYVISDHGMGPHTGASYHLAEWLEDQGFMVRNGGQAKRSFMNAGRRAARNLLPVSVKKRVKAGIGEARLERLQAAEKDSFYSSIDWSRTTAYTEPGRHVINVNLNGRNIAGIVAQQDYDKVCSQIIERLSEWTDSEGNKIVERVVRRDDAYSGPLMERANDLYVNWNPAARVGLPPAEVQERGFWWSGDHRPEGILICKGPGLTLANLAEAPAVYDLVPTMLYAAGLPVPDGLDGRVIRQLFTQEFLAEHPIRVDSASRVPGPDQHNLSPEEERLVEDKLRGLGYL